MRGILTILKYRAANYHEGKRNSPEIQNYVESLLSCGCRGRQVTFSWGPKSEKWPINPVKSIPGKGNNTLEAWMWFSTKPMARTQRVEWRKVQEDIRKRNRQITRGFSAKKLAIYSQGNGKPLENYKTRVTWLFLLKSWAAVRRKIAGGGEIREKQGDHLGDSCRVSDTDLERSK